MLVKLETIASLFRTDTNRESGDRRNAVVTPVETANRNPKDKWAIPGSRFPKASVHRI
jgi:hypothetical protein